MSSECNHNCDSCSQNCGDRKAPSLKAELNEASSVKKVISVVSGKGGVGKSLVTSLLAVAMNRKGFKTGILDADITGPSIPRGFGLKERAMSGEFGIIPVSSATGIDILSINSILPNETDPVLWRGPIIAGTIRQFWSQTYWNAIDYMFVDMPPGTGDVPLTVFQSLPVDGIVIVTSPQELVSMIVGKAINMARAMNVPVLGIVENMSWFQCDQCGKRHSLFGESHIDNVAQEYGIDTVSRLPIDPNLTNLCDTGRIETFEGDLLPEILAKIES